MNISDELLMAYADGQVDAITRLEVERAIAADPALRLIVDQHRSLRKRLNSTFDPILDDAVPDRLSKLLANPAAGVADFARARASRQELATAYRKPAVWMSLAASAVLGIAIGFAVFGRQETMVVADSGGLAARGDLDRALSTQLAANAPADAIVQIGVSYRSKSGQLCRSFAVNAGAYAGFACRKENIWRVRMLAPGNVTAAGEFRTAASAMPASVLEAIGADIDGEAFDADAEVRARAKDWR